MQWVNAHWGAIAGYGLLASWTLTCLANGLTKYPRAEATIHVLMDIVAATTHADSPGTFKLPGQRSAPPPGRLDVAVVNRVD